MLNVNQCSIYPLLMNDLCVQYIAFGNIWPCKQNDSAIQFFTVYFPLLFLYIKSQLTEYCGANDYFDFYLGYVLHLMYLLYFLFFLSLSYFSMKLEIISRKHRISFMDQNSHTSIFINLSYYSICYKFICTSNESVCVCGPLHF